MKSKRRKPLAESRETPLTAAEKFKANAIRIAAMTPKRKQIDSVILLRQDRRR